MSKKLDMKLSANYWQKKQDLHQFVIASLISYRAPSCKFDKILKSSLRLLFAASSSLYIHFNLVISLEAISHLVSAKDSSPSSSFDCFSRCGLVLWKESFFSFNSEFSEVRLCRRLSEHGNELQSGFSFLARLLFDLQSSFMSTRKLFVLISASEIMAFF